MSEPYTAPELRDDVPAPSKQHVILGTGQLGLAIMDDLVARGEAPTLVNRSGAVDEPLPPGVRVVAADLTDPDVVAGVTTGAQIVYFCAKPPYDRWPELFPPLTQAILDGLARQASSQHTESQHTESQKMKLVFGDNLYLYGPNGGKPIHEGLPPAAEGHKGRTRARIARMLQEAHDAGLVDVTIGRASDFFGPRCTASVLGDIVFGALVAGKPVRVLGDIDQPHSFTYIRDFARGLIILGEREEAGGRVWHVPNAPAVTTRQMLEEIAQQAGQPLRIRGANRFMLTVAGLFNAQLRELKETLYMFEAPYVVDHSRFVQAFGDVSTPRAQAIAETLAWFQAHQEKSDMSA